MKNKKGFKVINRRRFFTSVLIIMMVLLISIISVVSLYGDCYWVNKNNNSISVSIEKQRVENDIDEILKHLHDYPTDTEPVVNINDIYQNMPLYELPIDINLQKYIYMLSNKYNLSYELVLAVIKTESDFNRKAVSYNLSSRGAMQLERKTAKWLAEENKIKDFDVFNSYHNIACGIYYLDYLRSYWMSKGYNDEDCFNLMLLSYNQGVKNTYSFIKKYGLESKYTRKVEKYKNQLEEYGKFID